METNENEKLICALSGVEMDQEESFESDGNVYSKTMCIECEDCGDVVLRSDTHTVYHGNESVEVCNDCIGNYTECYICGRYHEIDELRSLVDGGYICDNCFDRGDYTQCVDCGDVVSYDRSYNYNGDTLCEECYHNRQPLSVINEYSYKPSPNFMSEKDESTELYFGMEVEVIAKNEDEFEQAAKEVQERLGERVYLKHDGSLDEGGFEIVTHPGTFAFWQKHPLAIEDLPIYSYKNASTGIHVHVSRNALRKIDIAKILYFFALPSNLDLIYKIAQRSETHYCQKQNKGEVLNDLQHHNERYKAINLQNKNTIEFRIFKGNTKDEAIKRIIQFCHAMVMFVKVTSVAHCVATEFLSFVKANEKDYPELNKYMN